jgi:hypothetical protein
MKANNVLLNWRGEAGVRFYATIKDEKRYAVEGSDTTMLPIAVFLLGQQKRSFFVQQNYL